MNNGDSPSSSLGDVGAGQETANLFRVALWHIIVMTTVICSMVPKSDIVA